MALGFDRPQRVTRGVTTINAKGHTMNQIDTLIAQIAKKHLDIETLETRNSDSLDFHDTAVWCIRNALEEAFKAGVEFGSTHSAAKAAKIAKSCVKPCLN